MESHDSMYEPYENNRNIFTCEVCRFSCRFDTYGRKIDKGYSTLMLKEDAFLLKDPFSAASEAPLVIGSPCASCKFTVCVGQSCSYFYEKRYCRPCMMKVLEKFPVPMQQEVRKRFTTS